MYSGSSLFTHVLICHLRIFFGELSVQVFGLLKNWVVAWLLSFKSSFYILDNSPLSDMHFANIFSQSVACLLILLTVSYEEQRLFILMKTSLSILSLVYHAFDVVSKKSSPCSRSPKFFSYVIFLGFL